MSVKEEEPGLEISRSGTNAFSSSGRWPTWRTILLYNTFI